jgi:predicted nucleic acid-binding protein
VRVFFDTSSFVKRFVEEVGSERADEITQAASQIGLSIICFPEIISVLNRKLRAELITEEIYLELKYEVFEDIKDAELINLTPAVLSRITKLLETNNLRSLDAIHIACALEWQAELFVSSDARQVAAAIESGLAVEFIAGLTSKSQE